MTLTLLRFVSLFFFHSGTCEGTIQKVGSPEIRRAGAETSPGLGGRKGDAPGIL